MRLAPYLMAVGLLAIRFRGAPDRRTAHVLAVLGLLFFSMRTIANTVSLGIAGADQRALLHAIDRMPEGARVITLTGMPCRETWHPLRNSHLGAMVIVRRDGFSNDQWLLEGVNLLDLKYRAAGYFAADPSQLVRPNGCRDRLHRTIDASLAALPRNDFDYAWLIDVPPYDPAIVARNAAGLARSGVDPLSSALMPALSIVVPCFNEEACLAPLHERLSGAARSAVSEDYEIVFVNDGSRDSTWDIMRRSPPMMRMSWRSICRATTGISWRSLRDSICAAATGS